MKIAVVSFRRLPITGGLLVTGEIVASGMLAEFVPNPRERELILGADSMGAELPTFEVYRSRVVSLNGRPVSAWSAY